jgi:hypothetical protein
LEFFSKVFINVLATKPILERWLQIKAKF